MRQKLAIFLSSVVLSGTFGCDKPAEPQPALAPPKVEAAPAAADKPADAKAPSEVLFDAPSRWQKAENPSPMRKATYKIPKADGDADDAELSVTQAGGSVDANVDRWSKQFEKTADDTTRREVRTVGSVKVTVVELTGTFASGMPGQPSNPKTDWAMLGAVVETQPQLTFFKLTGPKKTVLAAKSEFDQLIGGLRPK